MEIKITNHDGEIIDVIHITEKNELEETKKELYYLDPCFCKEFRDTINSSPIFSNDSIYLAQFNLCCAVMDRLDSCIARLNEYGDYPDSEEDLLIFMMFACMVIDGVKEILSELGVHDRGKKIYNSDEDYKYFKDIYEKSEIYNQDVSCPTDDKMFEYLRSLMFAHPFETSRAKFLKKNEKQYSPWVIVDRQIARLTGCQDAVGIRIYTSCSEKIIDLEFSFNTLKQYIKSRYERISLATDWARQQISITTEEWKKVKVNRNQSAIDTLIEIEGILASRYEESYGINKIIDILSCELSVESNRVSVNKFRKAILDSVPKICDAVDLLDNELLEEILQRFFVRPIKMHEMACYQLEKIFRYLNEEGENNIAGGNERWGLVQAEHFAKEFAKKWVTILPYQMSYNEIKLLVRAACFLEREEQEINSNR